MSGMQWRQAKGRLFGGIAGGALLLGLLVLLVLILSTLIQSLWLVPMQAVSEAGLALSLRGYRGEDGALHPYVSVALVEKGSPAEALGLHRGDALVRVGGHPVRRVKEVWAVVRGLPGGQRVEVPLEWVPRSTKLFGLLQAQPVPGEPGNFRIWVRTLPLDSPAARAGLKPGDQIVAVDGLEVTGTRQAWAAVVVAAQRASGPVALRIRRGEEELNLSLDPRVKGRLLVKRSLMAAFWRFLTRLNEPRYPEMAGLASAFVGSVLVVLVMILFAFPISVAAALYMEEYAAQGLFTEILQILIANLAGVPSVVYGIIGLEILARKLGLGRSILAGGLTLGLLSLPVVIISSREALRTVPQWVREAAYALGATRWQVVRYHVLPYALPGIFTGSILATARALGEAAPLILLGAFLYVNYIPKSLKDSFTVIPLQIFDWATRPQDGFPEIAAAAIVVLLALLFLMNSIAIWLRNRYQVKW